MGVDGVDTTRTHRNKKGEVSIYCKWVNGLNHFEDRMRLFVQNCVSEPKGKYLVRLHMKFVVPQAANYQLN